MNFLRVSSKHQANYVSVAFTLAEVLIVLGVIGIVAALTIPTIQNKIQKKDLESAFKKSYSNLAGTYSRAYNENGSQALDLTSQNDIATFFSYFKVSTTTSPGYTTPMIFDKAKTDPPYYVRFFFFPPARPSYVLADGSFIGLFSNNGAASGDGKIVIDTNGMKPPNRMGYDVFIFAIAGAKITPLWTTPVTSQCETMAMGGTANDYNGYGCAVWALENVCPWDSSQNYWSCLP